jgi:hypothetical protein
VEKQIQKKHTHIQTVKRGETDRQQIQTTETKSDTKNKQHETYRRRLKSERGTKKERKMKITYKENRQINRKQKENNTEKEKRKKKH